MRTKLLGLKLTQIISGTQSKPSHSYFKLQATKLLLKSRNFHNFSKLTLSKRYTFIMSKTESTDYNGSSSSSSSFEVISEDVSPTPPVKAPTSVPTKFPTSFAGL